MTLKEKIKRDLINLGVEKGVAAIKKDPYFFVDIISKSGI